ncbi:hypothetical protein [Methanobacterium petrolearium]|uniref:hypothetical protein n=1 Tax=Methanobacterium petrolearium TaxID=710190 RepID=UPI001AEB2165|nr:hypothetical protein [Methanobacterium petrolearium]MBP1945472.1 hypothetical protein [Methanobacterium petrolearium]BDZ71678.1 hypothetical protein GCM10025861_21950 [Methanobacterium petrolearium]
MGNQRYFSAQGVLNFIVIDNTNLKLFDTFYKHYQNFEVVEMPEKVDLVIKLGNFTPKTEDKYVVGYSKYYIGSDYFHVKKESYKGADWSFEVIGWDKKTTTVNIDFNTSGRIFITGNVIDFLIQWKLLQKSYSLIHASGISKNGKAVIFSARGGGGKTSLALESLNHDYNFLSDNYLMLKNGIIFGFPTSLSLFTYNLSEIILKNLKKTEKLSITFKNFVYKLSRGYAKFFTKINPQRISDLTSHSSLSTVFIIKPIERGENQLIIKKIERERALKKIFYNQMLEFPFFNQYIEIYSYIFPGKKFSKHWDLYLEILDQNLSENINFYEILTDGHYSFDELLKKIDEII